MGDTAREAADFLGGVAERMRDPQPKLSEEAKTVDGLIANAFASGVSPDGSAWAALAETPKSKKNPKPLSGGTGRMFGAIDVRVQRKRLIVEADVFYAHFIHGGFNNDAAQKTVPARPFLPFTPALEPMTTGPGGEWFDSLTERLAAYYVDEKK